MTVSSEDLNGGDFCLQVEPRQSKKMNRPINQQPPRARPARPRPRPRPGPRTPRVAAAPRTALPRPGPRASKRAQRTPPRS